LLNLGRKRLGQVDERVEAAIASMADLEQLHQLLDRVLDAPSWDELLHSEES
jgi:HPt (histidine-containing phosphotransfer) domain-containing protein